MTDLNINTIEEFIKLGKDNPGKIRVGHLGPGSGGYAALKQFEKSVGDIKYLDIPFDGDGPTAMALAGGHIEAAFISSSSTVDFVEMGKIKLLAATTSMRLAELPELPTLQELGYQVQVNNMQGYIAPAGVPRDRINILHDALKAALEDPSLIAMLKKMHIIVLYRDGDTFKKLTEAEIKGIKKVANE